MRIIKLYFDDYELFHSGLNSEKYTFFNINSNVFKRMWTEQGLTYWLRFLITFKTNFTEKLHEHVEVYSCNESYSVDKVLDYICINIHKKFIEDYYVSAKVFMENIFVIASNVCNLPQALLSKKRNPFYMKESRTAFRRILGQPLQDKKVPVSLMIFASAVYLEFSGSVCTLLKRWIEELDVSDSDLHKIQTDSLLYWKPLPEWTEEKYVPMCFDRYIADYWKENLPKMLLTCDIHNIFSRHEKSGCCDMYQNETLFYLFDKDNEILPTEKQFEIVPFSLLKPRVSYCKNHGNCRMKIEHDLNCTEPFLCNGIKPCNITCESILKNKQTNLNNSKNLWKEFFIESLPYDKKKCSVATQVEIFDQHIETFYFSKKDNWPSIEKKQFRNELCPVFYPEFPCFFRQFKRTEETKNRLRKKLSKKQNGYTYDHLRNDSKSLNDPLYLLYLYDRAQATLFQQLYRGGVNENLKNYNIINATDKNDCAQLNNFPNIVKVLTTVAVGTNDVLSGRVVLPSSFFYKSILKNKESEKTLVCKQVKVKRKKSSVKIQIDHSITENIKISNASSDVTQCSVFKDKGNASLNNNSVCMDIGGGVDDNKVKLQILTEKGNQNSICKKTEQLDVLLSETAENVTNFASDHLDSNTEEFNALEMKVAVNDDFKRDNKTVTNNPDLDEKQSDHVDAFFKLICKGSRICSGKVLNDTEAVISKCDNTPTNICKKVEKKLKLRVCSFCHKKEEQYKTFKRCSLCKVENFTDQRYYCSRECQIEDWEETHRDEHMEKEKTAL